MALAICDAVIRRSSAVNSTADAVKKYLLKGLATGSPIVKWMAGALVFVFDDAFSVRAAALVEKVADKMGRNAEKALQDIEGRILTANDINSAVEAIIEKQKFLALKFLEQNRGAEIRVN
jgi:hypothetical protein